MIRRPTTTGPDSFTFKANDGQVDSAAATVSITVTPVNDLPMAHGQSATTLEDTPKVITLTGSDADGDALSLHRRDRPGAWNTDRNGSEPDL